MCLPCRERERERRERKQKRVVCSHFLSTWNGNEKQTSNLIWRQQRIKSLSLSKDEWIDVTKWERKGERENKRKRGRECERKRGRHGKKLRQSYKIINELNGHFSSSSNHRFQIISLKSSLILSFSFSFYFLLSLTVLFLAQRENCCRMDRRSVFVDQWGSNPITYFNKRWRREREKRERRGERRWTFGKWFKEWEESNGNEILLKLTETTISISQFNLLLSLPLLLSPFHSLQTVIHYL